MKNTKRGIAQSLVFYGQDSYAQYYLALELARLLNCQKDGDTNCNCINCNWIRNNQHPAILTITKNDNKPADDSSTKVISIKQTQSINNSLINSSDYYRVFIFCDSEIVTKIEQNHRNQLEELNFSFPQDNWCPKPLNREVLGEASANSMLKSIEEPPERTLFIFLTNDKEDIIETIISRSQCFYVPANTNYNIDTNFLTPIFKSYPNIKKIDVINIVAELLEIMNNNSYSSEYVLDSMEFYFVEMIKRNIANKILVQKIKRDINSIQLAKKQYQAYIKPQIIFEDLFFKFLN